MCSPNRNMDLVSGNQMDISEESGSRIPSRRKWLVFKPYCKGIGLPFRIQEWSNIDMERAVAIR